MKLAVFLLALSYCMISCKDINSEEELFKILNSEPFKVVKSSSGFSFTAKYLPPEFLAWKELKYENKEWDSDSFKAYIKPYSQTHTILFNIAPDNKSNDIDIMKYQIAKYEDYKKRVLSLNFDFKEYIYLKRDDQRVYPVLSSMENHYGLKKDRSFYLVFPKSREELSGFQLVFEDAFFESGIHHFLFNSEVYNLPELKIISS